MRNPLKRRPRDETKPTLRERAAILKAAASRVMKRRPADQPPALTLSRGSSVDQEATAFSVNDALTDYSPRELPGTLSRDVAAAGTAPMEHAMGRHETFESATPLADELLRSTILGQLHAPDPIFAAIEAHREARDAFEMTVCPADKIWVAEHGGNTSSEAMAAAQVIWERASSAEQRAWNTLFTVRPVTQAGVVALTLHAREYASEQDGEETISLEDIFSAIATAVSELAHAAPRSDELTRGKA